MTYHVRIKVERRTSTEDKPRHLATAMNNDLRTPTGKLDKNGMPTYTITSRPPQLHEHCEEINDWSNIDYAAQWDGRTPWVEVLQGDLAGLNMAFMGWPMVTQEQWLAAQPEVEE